MNYIDNSVDHDLEASRPERLFIVVVHCFFSREYNQWLKKT